MPGPFPSSSPITVVLPSPAGATGDEARLLVELPRLLRLNAAALKRELGADIRVTADDPGFGSRWFIGPASRNPGLAALPHDAAEGPYLWRGTRILVTNANDIEGVFETFGLLRSLHRLADGLTEVRECDSVDEAAAFVQTEVGDTWPSFRLKNVDWARVCQRHLPRVKASGDPIMAMRTWLAELGDAHTWIRRAQPMGRLPYELAASQREAILVSVPTDSAGYQAGARLGQRLLGVDPGPFWRATAATTHARSLVAGRHLLTGALGVERVMQAQGAGGRRIVWREAPVDPYAGELVSWEKRASGAGYLRIKAWMPGIESALDEAFEALRGSTGLIVDLRGNGGGNLFLATAFRDRFLRKERQLGWIRYSTAGGALSEAEKIIGTPAPEKDRWPGQVRFLTDPLTYSASEDALLGLQGAPHVQIFGTPSGGGSGRSRSLRLLAGFRLTISTALTYDTRWRCVEGAGIAVDRRVRPARPTETDEVLAAADRGW